MAAEAEMWMECFAGDTRIEAGSLEAVADRFVAHANESHDWPYPEEALRNYARNYAEANLRLTGDTERLDQIGEVSVHPVTEDRIDDWIGFFYHDCGKSGLGILLLPGASRTAYRREP